MSWFLNLSGQERFLNTLSRFEKSFERYVDLLEVKHHIEVHNSIGEEK